jgi:hypothetical protein
VAIAKQESAKKIRSGITGLKKAKNGDRHRTETSAKSQTNTALDVPQPQKEHAQHIQDQGTIFSLKVSTNSQPNYGGHRPPSII